MYSEQKDLVTQASQELVRINIPHSVQNILQAKFPHDMECLCYQVPIASNAVFNSIITALSTFTYIKSFNFTAILSAIYSSPENASISFIFIAKIKSNLPSILELFEQCNITYLQTFTTLIFKASPTQLEEALLKALDLGISVPPSFLNSTKRIVFSNTEHYLQARILPFSDLGIVELQIIRCDLCTTSDLYFTPSFLTFIKQRFHCVNQPQLCTVKNHCGEIREVLAITSSSQIFQHIPRDDLPFSFTHDDHSFSLSYLEPILHISPKPTVEYPYETQLEHFQRFMTLLALLLHAFLCLTPIKLKVVTLRVILLCPYLLDSLITWRVTLILCNRLRPTHFTSSFLLSMTTGKLASLIFTLIPRFTSSILLFKILPSTFQNLSSLKFLPEPPSLFLTFITNHCDSPIKDGFPSPPFPF